MHKVVSDRMCVVCACFWLHVCGLCLFLIGCADCAGFWVAVQIVFVSDWLFVVCPFFLIDRVMLVLIFDWLYAFFACFSLAVCCLCLFLIGSLFLRTSLSMPRSTPLFPWGGAGTTFPHTAPLTFPSQLRMRIRKRVSSRVTGRKRKWREMATVITAPRGQMGWAGLCSRATGICTPNCNKTSPTCPKTSHKLSPTCPKTLSSSIRARWCSPSLIYERCVCRDNAAMILSAWSSSGYPVCCGFSHW